MPPPSETDGNSRDQQRSASNNKDGFLFHGDTADFRGANDGGVRTVWVSRTGELRRAEAKNVTAIQSEGAQRGGFRVRALPRMKSSAHFYHFGPAFISGERNEAFRRQQRQNLNRQIEFD
jgi:hypothetical protein